MPITPQERRLLNQWNAARHGWDRFQASSRRATLRLAHKHHDLDDQTNTSQEKPDALEAP